MAWKFKRPGSANWWIGYWLNGKKHRRSVGTPDEAQADRELAKLNLMDNAHKAGALTEEFYRLLTNNHATSEALRPYAAQWLKECRDLSPKTLDTYRRVMDSFCTHLSATDAAPLLKEVRPESVASFIRQKRAATSTATAHLNRKVLRAFFGWAVDNRALQMSPVPSARSLKLTKESKRVRRAFTLKELKTLYESAQNDFWRWMVMAGFYMGQRMGDLITLPWGAVDFEQNVIRMTASKTGRMLTIPLRAELRGFLLKLRPGTFKASDPIWPEESKKYEKFGAGLFSNEFYDEVLLRAGLVVKRSKHPAKDENGKPVLKRGRRVNPVSFHCLRHTFVSLLKVTGGSQAVAKELAGHSSDAVSDLYTHVPEEALSKAIGQLPEVTK